VQREIPGSALRSRARNESVWKAWATGAPGSRGDGRPVFPRGQTRGQQRVASRATTSVGLSPGAHLEKLAGNAREQRSGGALVESW